MPVDQRWSTGFLLRYKDAQPRHSRVIAYGGVIKVLYEGLKITSFGGGIGGNVV